MCMSPSTPKIPKASDTPAPPPPIDTATTLRGPTGIDRNSTGLDQKRKGRNALRIVRDPSSTNVPSNGSGVNA